MKHIKIDTDCEDYLMARYKILDEWHRAFIKTMLEKYEWNIREAALRTGLTQIEFIDKINHYGIKLTARDRLR
ncbi:hypothetical protein HN419_05010 [Candidatus Woesearchaeota archaeon]|jgi:DNA-binding NtrC family response regulator|nr:hypothetical protein [Candidatus Woesearchaeota archaeon]MBT3537763.1 hypothetical protein [Candidatus Woesearchaeota archaeon]MBT4697894.1 hypothetical protein [Candidatus Woesearchaeota archaeon]MBT4717257.1 hypothetical protein [Candidatus Woesearchaeota archaeon]MBT7105432.1 hypothetical protein [Candidatus Woesearchaeota archaeon]